MALLEFENTRETCRIALMRAYGRTIMGILIPSEFFTRERAGPFLQ
jgi:hypothetical protein